MILKALLCYAILLVTVQASGDLVFSHHPEGVKFIGNEKIEQSDFTDVGLMLLGLTPREDPNLTWKGMSIKNPLNSTKALIVIAVEGPKTLDRLKGHHFPLDCNEHEETTWNSLSENLPTQYNGSSSVRLNLGDDLSVLRNSALGELECCPPMKEEQYEHLKADKPEHRKFLEELHLLLTIKQKLPSIVNTKRLIWLVIPGLNPIIKSQGKDSEAFKEAKLLLDKSLDKMSQSIASIKDQQVVLAAFTSCVDPASPSRPKRASGDAKEDDGNITVETTTENKLLSENVPINNITNPDKIDELEERNKHKEDEEELNKLSHSTEHIINTTTEKNIIQSTENPNKNWDDNNTKSVRQEVRLIPGPVYNHNYPILFNIFLWFGVAFIFSLIAICVTIADMDPGRDSIIYRMTSNRMKKDN